MFALINDSNDISTQQQAPLSCGNPLGGLENRDCESLIAHSCQLIGQPEDPSPSSSPCRSFLGFGEGGQGREYDHSSVLVLRSHFCTGCALIRSWNLEGKAMYAI